MRNDMNGDGQVGKRNDIGMMTVKNNKLFKSK